MSIRQVLADYAQISKARIAFSLLLVAWGAMFVAAQGLPSGKTWLAVTVAGIASTASAGALNHVWERERDGRMERTSKRPVASGRISPWAATIYAAVMGVLSWLALWLPGHRLAAGLTLGAIAYYVVVYTMVLKPNTAQNIVIGGFAGSFPALIGWAAVTGSLAAPAWAIAILVFLWTPAHFWALALMYESDYARGGYPMMPNVRGAKSTRRQIVVYSALTLLSSLALVALDAAGWLYLVVALLLGGLLVVRSVKLNTHPEPSRVRAFFFWTISYLGLLMAALMLDAVLHFQVL